MYKIVTKTLKKSRKCFNPCPRLYVSRENIKETVESLPHGVRWLLDELCKYRQAYGTVFPSQATLAGYLGVSVRTVQNHLNMLVSLGFIGKWYRHMRSSLYNIHPLFFDGYWREKLKHILPALGSKKALTLRSLLSFFKHSANTGFKGIIWTSCVRYLYKDNYITKRSSRSWREPLNNKEIWVRGVPPSPNSRSITELDEIFGQPLALKASVQTIESTTNHP